MEARTERLSFRGASGAMLDGRLDLPAGVPRAWALFAHCFGCSKHTVAAGRISRALTRHHVAVLRFDFTGQGSSETAQARKCLFRKAIADPPPRNLHMMLWILVSQAEKAETYGDTTRPAASAGHIGIVMPALWSRASAARAIFDRL